MAIDESLLCLFDAEGSKPILRTYAWDPPSLSLGRFQSSGEVLDLERCCSNSVSLVRRVSGGGTIYHADEMTYSIVCSPKHIPYTTSVKDSFRVLTGFLIDFYRRLGLNAHYAIDVVSNTKRLGERTAFCFAGKESFDILIDGKKIGGNAQRRGRNVIFQHGSIPLINRAQQGLQFMKDRSAEYAQDTVSLSECGISEDVTTLKGLIIEAFRHHLGVEIYVSDLSREERRMSQELLFKKYSSDGWNLLGDVE